MTYYRIIEYEPKNWINTKAIIAMGGIHYHTLMKGNDETFIRKFIVDFSEEDLVAAKLRFGEGVDITDIPQWEFSSLQSMGYLK